ncbi:MAG: ATP-binding protein, partial [Eubacterium sp.]|nr:ATP-binding protein [Eubacterium sp.]
MVKQTGRKGTKTGRDGKMREEELIVYKDFEDGQTLHDMVWLMESYRSGDGRMRPLFFECMHRLLEMAATHGFVGNLWHCYLTNLLVNNENSYSVACEIRGEVEGSINQLALHDITIFKEFYDFDFTEMMEVLKAPEFSVVIDYVGTADSSKVYSTKIRDRICRLAEQFAATENALEMKAVLTGFYREYGVGKFGLHKAFRVVHTDEGARIDPIRNISHVQLDDLIGYEIPKKKLTDNTDAFVAGRKANNCLLFGDAGTGKS